MTLPYHAPNSVHWNIPKDIQEAGSRHRIQKQALSYRVLLESLKPLPAPVCETQSSRGWAPRQIIVFGVPSAVSYLSMDS